MPLVPILPPYQAPFLPITNITPFTYKDGETYLKLQLRIQKYLTDTLIPYVGDNFEALGEEFQTQVNLVIDTVNTQLAAQDEAVTAELAAQLATITAELATKIETIVAGAGIAVDDTDPLHPIVSAAGVLSVVAGDNIGVDATDPKHPIVSNQGVRGITAGANATIDNTDPHNPIVAGTGIVEAVVAGANVVVNNADPTHPIVSASGGGGGGGIVDTVVGSTHIAVDATDPANPIVSATGLVIGVSAGTGVTVDNTDPTHPVIASAPDGVASLTAGAHITIDATDPAHPVVAATGLVDSVTAGTNVTVDNTDPNNPIVSTAAKVASVVAGSNITIDNTDTANPVASTLAKVTAVVAGTGITVDNTDPHNPVVAAGAPAFVAPESAGAPGSPVEGTVYADTHADRLIPYINGAFRRPIPMQPPGHYSYATYCKVDQSAGSTYAFSGDKGAWAIGGTTGIATSQGSSLPALLPLVPMPYMFAAATAGTAAVAAFHNNLPIGPVIPLALTSPINKMRYHVRLRGGHGGNLVNANNRFFIGFSADSGGTGDTQPSADIGMFGLGWDSADTVAYIMHNDLSGAATKIATTIPAFNKNSGNQAEQFFDIEADIYFNGTAWQVDLTVTDIKVGTTQSASFTTDIYLDNATTYNPTIKASAGGTSWPPNVHFIDCLTEIIVD